MLRLIHVALHIVLARLRGCGNGLSDRAQADTGIEATGHSEQAHEGENGVDGAKCNAEQTGMKALQDGADEVTGQYNGDEGGKATNRVDDSHDAAHVLARGTMQGQRPGGDDDGGSGDTEKESCSQRDREVAHMRHEDDEQARCDQRDPQKPAQTDALSNEGDQQSAHYGSDAKVRAE